MQVKVKLLKGGREAAVEVLRWLFKFMYVTAMCLYSQVENSSLSVLGLKQKLADVFEIPVAEQSVVFRGKALLGE